MKAPIMSIWILLLLSPFQAAPAQVQMGVSVGDEGLRGFYLTVGQYFHRPEREVVVVRERGFREEEVPVVFFIAARANVAPNVIIDLRAGGMRWIDICGRYHINPEVFYVPVSSEVSGPPYGNAYGYYKKHPKKQWKTIVLSDDDVVNLVNLRVISDHYRIPPAEVIRLRSEGRTFVAVNDDVRRGARGNSEMGRSDKPGKGKGRGKHK